MRLNFRTRTVMSLISMGCAFAVAGEKDTVFGDGFESRPPADCSYDAFDIEMLWEGCGGKLECYEDAAEFYLVLPSQGPVARNAHLVTTSENFEGPWPSSSSDGITNHYAVSQSASGYDMERSDPWKPAGEGGSEWGQGATGARVDALQEAWYVSMAWAARPTAGTRMIIKNLANGKAVVAAAGLDTGPFANSIIAGVPEEIHDYLGTNHLSELELGFAEDQLLDLGPIQCL